MASLFWLQGKRPAFFLDDSIHNVGIATLVYIIPKTRVVAFIFRLRERKMPTLPHLIANAKIKWLSRSLSIQQFRAVTASDIDGNAILKNFSELLGGNTEYEYICTPEYRAWHLIRSPHSTHTIMYVHGGGFVSGSSSSVTSYLLQLHLELAARGLVSDMVAVEYDLAPEYPYPHALRQIVSAYEYVRAQSKPIVLMGDSAGGNLCLALLRHLVYPHPQIQPSRSSRNASEGITAACLASPWVDLRERSISDAKAPWDCLDVTALKSWRDAYLGTRPVDEYTSALGMASPKWNDILPPKMLLMSGDLDLFLAQIKSLADEIKNVRHTLPPIKKKPKKNKK
ncbi:Alpha/Beta hydrolase protein [Thelonectria olida]|uniref:Alpha/Beta hydrolase protein n=1 Tax=Thelonectria olida TaxID=1576542 RepID=A0A9P8VS02_9HYPO|nr:Alpha/Beta hydrolase protein [Thelonectria olida]